MEFEKLSWKDKEQRKELISRSVLYLSLVFALLGFFNLMGELYPIDGMIYLLLWVILFFVHKGRIDLSRQKPIVAEVVLLPFMMLFTFYYSQMFGVVYGHYNQPLTIFGKMIHGITFYVPLHWVCYIGIYLCIYNVCKIFCKSIKISVLVASAPFLLYGFACYLTAMWRGNVFLFTDFSSLKTAANVAEGFSFPVKGAFYYFFIPQLLILLILYFLRLPNASSEKNKKQKYLHKLIRLVIAVVSMIACVVSFNIVTAKTVVQSYKLNSCYNTVIFINFLQSFDARLAKPDGYTEEVYTQMLADAGGASVEGVNVEDLPNVIVIMNESLTDFSIFPGVELSSDPMDYWHSLDALDNAETGYALSSIYGGSTSNSEFEFLTGLSVEMVSAGSNAYNSYFYENHDSIISLANELGYTTLGFHPYERSGWNREKVYPFLGFDQITFIEDIDVSDEDLCREYYSDIATYQYVIDRMNELAPNERMFAFVVTMQNHSPYYGEFEDFTSEEFFTTTIPDAQETTDMFNFFLTLVQESDEALEEFLRILEEDDEDYVVLMFGDHQPNIPVADIVETNRLSTRMDRIHGLLTIPYMIWTNSDSGLEIPEIPDIPVASTSINYLGLDVLSAAGIPYTDYYALLNQSRQALPVINSMAYYDANDNMWHENDELRRAIGLVSDDGVAETDEEIIEAYRAMQYMMYNEFG